MKYKWLCGLTSSIEWFDFTLYGFFAPILSKEFFANPKNSLILTYLIFSLGFFARPIGGLIFGYIGDRYGRLAPLRATPLLITFLTAMIAFIPTYNSIGNASIILLVTIRFLQGIVLGGEFSGNVVYLYESSNNWKYFWGSISSCSGSFGIILASLTVSMLYFFLSKTFLYELGWRIAFLFSIPLGIASFLVRLKLHESQEYRQSALSGNPLLKAFLNYKSLLIMCIGIISLHAASFYFTFMFIPAFLEKIRNVPHSSALLHNSIFLILHLLFIPIFGIVVNFIGGIRSKIIIILSFSLLILPIFSLVAYGNENQIFYGILILSIMSSINAAIIPALLSKIIPCEIRYTILALSFNVGFAIFGGVTPALGLYLVKITGVKTSPAIYILITSLVTLLFLLLSIKTRKSYEVGKLSYTRS